MGGSSWSDTVYRDAVRSKVDSHGTAFVYDKDVRSGKAAKAAHKDLDPKGVKVRESRDSDAHPESNAIIVILDVTGSMRHTPHEIHSKLSTLMGLLTRKDYIPHPQIMFCAVGDAFSDRVPLQVGQFESGAEMEGDLSKFFLEGGGGGSREESYELMAYFAARHTSIDCFEKRNKKGYCFFIGDEKPYATISRENLEQVIGATEQADLKTSDIFRELQAKYNTFLIRPSQASYKDDPEIEGAWNELLEPQHLLHLDKTEYIAELIASQIGICEGTVDVAAAAANLKSEGADEGLIKSVSTALSKGYTGGTVAKASDDLKPTGKSSVERL